MGVCGVLPPRYTFFYLLFCVELKKEPIEEARDIIQGDFGDSSVNKSIIGTFFYTFLDFFLFSRVFVL